MGNMLCGRREENTLYDDYIFNHAFVLRIEVTALLTRHIRPNDYIILKVVLDNQTIYHTCLVYSVESTAIHVEFIDPNSDFDELKYIKKL